MLPGGKKKTACIGTSGFEKQHGAELPGFLYALHIPGLELEMKATRDINGCGPKKLQKSLLSL